MMAASALSQLRYDGEVQSLLTTALGKELFMAATATSSGGVVCGSPRGNGAPSSSHSTGPPLPRPPHSGGAPCGTSISATFISLEGDTLVGYTDGHVTMTSFRDSSTQPCTSSTVALSTQYITGVASQRQSPNPAAALPNTSRSRSTSRAGSASGSSVLPSASAGLGPVLSLHCTRIASCGEAAEVARPAEGAHLLPRLVVAIGYSTAVYICIIDASAWMADDVHRVTLPPSFARTLHPLRWISEDDRHSFVFDQATLQRELHNKLRAAMMERDDDASALYGSSLTTPTPKVSSAQTSTRSHRKGSGVAQRPSVSVPPPPLCHLSAVRLSPGATVVAIGVLQPLPVVLLFSLPSSFTDGAVMESKGDPLMLSTTSTTNGAFGTGGPHLITSCFSPEIERLIAQSWSPGRLGNAHGHLGDRAIGGGATAASLKERKASNMDGDKGGRLEMVMEAYAAMSERRPLHLSLYYLMEPSPSPIAAAAPPLGSDACLSQLLIVWEGSAFFTRLPLKESLLAASVATTTATTLASLFYSRSLSTSQSASFSAPLAQIAAPPAPRESSRANGKGDPTSPQKTQPRRPHGGGETKQPPSPQPGTAAPIAIHCVALSTGALHNAAAAAGHRYAVIASCSDGCVQLVDCLRTVGSVSVLPALRRQQKMTPSITAFTSLHVAVTSLAKVTVIAGVAYTMGPRTTDSYAAVVVHFRLTAEGSTAEPTVQLLFYDMGGPVEAGLLFSPLPITLLFIGPPRDSIEAGTGAEPRVVVCDVDHMTVEQSWTSSKWWLWRGALRQQQQFPTPVLPTRLGTRHAGGPSATKDEQAYSLEISMSDQKNQQQSLLATSSVSAAVVYGGADLTPHGIVWLQRMGPAGSHVLTESAGLAAALPMGQQTSTAALPSIRAAYGSLRNLFAMLYPVMALHLPNAGVSQIRDFLISVPPHRRNDTAFVQLLTAQRQDAPKARSSSRKRKDMHFRSHGTISSRQLSGLSTTAPAQHLQARPATTGTAAFRSTASQPAVFNFPTLDTTGAASFAHEWLDQLVMGAGTESQDHLLQTRLLNRSSVLLSATRGRRTVQ